MHRMVWSSFGLILLTGAGLTQAVARDIYVNNGTGDDRFTGASPEHTAGLEGPVRSVAKALRIVRQGDRIVLDGSHGPYHESVTLEGSRHSGLNQQNLIILGNGAILDGTAPVPHDAWNLHSGSTFRFQPPKRQYQQLFREGKPIAMVPSSPLAGAPPKLTPLQGCLHEGYLYFCCEPDKRPEDYQLSYSDQDSGITLYHVSKVSITDLVVQGFRIDGINAFNSATDIRLHRVTARGNGRTGITIGGASVVEVESSLVGNNGEAQVLAQEWSELRVLQSELLSNTAAALVDQGGRVFIDGKRLVGGLDQRKAPQ